MASSRKSISDLSGRVADALAPVVPHGSSLLLGLSGGLDSVVLLHVLAQLSPSFSWRLSALHVHHGISPHADAWAEFCAEVCAGHAVPLQVERVDITPLRDMGIEAAARQLRHAALARQPVDFIALAHHRDDQAETLLLQLLRGAGVRGGSAMPLLKTRAGAPALLRPLLGFERGELERYAREQGLRWVEDESNADVGYPRNFLRHRVLPILAQRFPAYRATLARSARHFAEAAELLDELAALDAAMAVQGDHLRVEVLRQLSVARGKNLLRHFLAARRAPIPDHTRLAEMLRQLCEARADARLRITWQGWQLRCYRAHAYVLPQTLPPREFALDWRGEAELILPDPHGVLHFEVVQGQGISREKLRQGGVQVRSRHGDVSIQPAATRPHLSLRKLLQEQGMPPWQRELLPLLYSGEELVCVPGVAVSARYQAQADEPGVVPSWHANNQCP
ncbi:MAG TPA: tRNA lysidine(34) synthetase TilS [Gallionellaceae bacterium]|nr:tRNA lysidine(34) synthetase TilS [Gallionellaceae bacterium]